VGGARRATVAVGRGVRFRVGAAFAEVRGVVCLAPSVEGARRALVEAVRRGVRFWVSVVFI
jgi:hypothetical protein